MSDYYETDGSCRRCLRSSPACSLIGLILVFLGTVGFGTGAILFRRYFMNDSLDPSIDKYAWIDYIFYGIIGGIALFTILAYLLCSLSSGYNSKRCFDTSRKSCCGRCCNMFLILCLCFGILLWIIIFAGTSLVIGNYMQLMSDKYEKLDDFNFPKLFQTAEETTTESAGPSGESISLSPYGFKDLTISQGKLDQVKEKSLLCLGAVFVGELFILFGYLIMVICVAMNFARLQERRYYEVDDGDETIALR